MGITIRKFDSTNRCGQLIMQGDSGIEMIHNKSPILRGRIPTESIHHGILRGKCHFNA